VGVARVAVNERQVVNSAAETRVQRREELELADVLLMGLVENACDWTVEMTVDVITKTNRPVSYRASTSTRTSPNTSVRLTSPRNDTTF